MTAGAAVAAAWREHWARLLALLTARFERVDLAEDALAEAFESAARTWPRDGVPESPVAWLHRTAQRQVIDRLRNEASAHRAAARVAEDLTRRAGDEPQFGEVSDEMLRLLFLACHPALPAHAQTALALRWVLAVPTERIAELFAVTHPTMSARLTRARQRAVADPSAFAVPEGPDLTRRIEGVLRTAHLFFTSGYAPADGDRVVRTDVCAEAIRLVALVDDLLPARPDVMALRSLLELQNARRAAREGADGEVVLLGDQDRRRWRQDEIAVAMTRLLALDPAHGFAEELRLQALIAGVHAIAPTSAETDWALALTFYDRLLELSGDDPVVRVNRAVAVAEVADALEALEQIADVKASDHRVAGVLGELRGRIGDWGEAARLFSLAASWCACDPVRRHYERRHANAVANITLAQ